MRVTGQVPRFGDAESILRNVSQTLWLVTAAAGSRRGGLVATWVMQASLDSRQPVMLVSLGSNHYTRELVDAAQAFALHPLAARHTDLALWFATTSGRDVDKFHGLATSTGVTGAPLLEDARAWLECRTVARLSTGDRVYYWGDVVAAQCQGHEPPLTDQEWFAQLQDGDRARLHHGREQDLLIQGPLWQQWRDQLPSGLSPWSADR